MENSNSQASQSEKKGFAVFAAKQVIIIAVCAIIGLWLIIKVLGFFSGSPSQEVQTAAPHETKVAAAKPKAAPDKTTGHAGADTDHGDDASVSKNAHTSKTAHTADNSAAHATSDTHSSPVKSPEAQKTASHAAKKSAASHAPVVKPSKAPGVAFVEALIEPMDFELNHRWWGWRPNDILNFTDNVNNMQLGTLEVTRRTVVVLAERISRTGVTAAFDPNLEPAMNWFMIKADRYWFPSAESKYKEGLEELTAYKKRLERRTAPFYVRTDNLIPLLTAYMDLLGSCEENLVKFTEEDGDPVGFFSADDYFYYAKGVTSAMVKILEAVAMDFELTVESRRGYEVLHHAIEACHHASGINPLIITNSPLDGILANHRANLAAPLSHARFYLEVLVKTLST